MEMEIKQRGNLEDMQWSVEQQEGPVTTKGKGNVYKTVVRPTILYGAETCGTTKGRVNISSYIVQYPTPRIAQSALHFISLQTCSIRHHLKLSGKHPAICCN